MTGFTFLYPTKSAQSTPIVTVIVGALHAASKTGEPKIRRRCTLPLTGRDVIRLIMTELCVLYCDRRHGGPTLDEVATA